MFINREEREGRLLQYVHDNALTLEREVGFGIHGTVHSTARKTVVKVYDQELFYVRERDVYIRLKERGVERLSDCAVPRLVNFDDALWVIEMTIVNPPFILDFAGAYLDQRPDYSEEALADWEAERSELFGDDWPKVLAIRAALTCHGIFYYDVHPNNIRLR